VSGRLYRYEPTNLAPKKGRRPVEKPQHSSPRRLYRCRRPTTPNLSPFRGPTTPRVTALQRAARRRVLEQAVSSLTGAMRRAVAALARRRKCGGRGVQVRAAVAVLSQALQAAELLDLAERVEAPERQAVG
jgi:hypothetical protein